MTAMNFCSNFMSWATTNHNFWFNELNVMTYSWNERWHTENGVHQKHKMDLQGKFTSFILLRPDLRKYLRWPSTRSSMLNLLICFAFHWYWYFKLLHLLATLQFNNCYLSLLSFNLRQELYKIAISCYLFLKHKILHSSCLHTAWLHDSSHHVFNSITLHLC